MLWQPVNIFTATIPSKLLIRKAVITLRTAYSIIIFSKLRERMQHNAIFVTLQANKNKNALHYALKDYHIKEYLQSLHSM